MTHKNGRKHNKRTINLTGTWDPYHNTGQFTFTGNTASSYVLIIALFMKKPEMKNLRCICCMPSFLQITASEKWHLLNSFTLAGVPYVQIFQLSNEFLMILCGRNCKFNNSNILWNRHIKIHIFVPSNCTCDTWQNTGNKTMYIKADNNGNVRATV
jgi:hypothetical protein